MNKLNPPAQALRVSPPAAGGGLQPGLNRVDQLLCRQPPVVLWSVTLCLVAAIAASDRLTGYDMSLAVLYLAPIFIASWALGPRAGILASMICTASWSLSVLLMHSAALDPLLQVWDGSIQFVMFVVFSVVISNLKRALGRADERFATVLEGMDAAVYVCHAETGELLYANERFRASFPPGSSLPALPTGKRQGEFQDTASGRWHLVHSRNMRWIDESEVRLFLVTDITERKRTEALLHQQQEKLEATARLVAVGEMASTLAHELNQPLAAVVNYSRGCVRRLRSADWSAPELLETIEKAAAQAERAGEVLQRVRAFIARRTPNPIPCELNRIVQGIGPMLAVEARQLGAEVALDLEDRLPQVRGDPILLEQVILNLARNGLEAMREAPKAERRLEIRSRGDGRAIVLDVEDRGRGIDPQLEARLFTPFFTTKADGMGLGLHICRSIVEAHGGRIWMSRNAGRGVTLHFSLGTIGE